MRLINDQQIHDEIIARRRTWLRSQPGFPEVKIRGSGRGGNLYIEDEVRAWLARFVAEQQHVDQQPAEQQRADKGRRLTKARTAAAVVA